MAQAFPVDTSAIAPTSNPAPNPAAPVAHAPSAPAVATPATPATHAPATAASTPTDTSFAFPQLEIPPAPQYEPLPKQPVLNQDTKHQVGQFALMTAIMMAISGRATGASLEGATRFLAGAVDGMNKGNEAAFKDNMEKWQLGMKEAIAHNNTLQQQYMDVLKSRQMTYEQKWKRIGIIAQINHDQAMERAAQGRNAIVAQKVVDDRNMGLAKLHLQQGLVASEIEKNQAQTKKASEVNQGQNLTDTQLEPAAWSYLFTGKLPYLGMGTSAMRPKIIAMAQKIGSDMGLSPQQQALLPTSTKAKEQALNFMTKWQAGVKRSGLMVVAQANIMRDLVSKLGLTNVKSINKAILAGKREFGDPDAQAYANAAYTLMTEYARAISGPTSNAQMAEGNTERAAKIIDQSQSPAQFNASLDLIEKEVRNAEASNADVIEKINESMQVQQPGAPTRATPTTSTPLGWGSVTRTQ